MICIALLASGAIPAGADIAPMRVMYKTIRPVDAEVMVQMRSEKVDIRITPDSAFVECLFEMKNHGGDVTMEVGFPIMNFFNRSSFYSGIVYSARDKEMFRIEFDGRTISPEDIHIPPQLDSIYRSNIKYYEARERYAFMHDSLKSHYNLNPSERGMAGASEEARMAFDSLYSWRGREIGPLSGRYVKSKDSGNNIIERNDYPWYLWTVSFRAGETKTIKVTYATESGKAHSVKYRYVHYLLNTGAGWYGAIEEAKISVTLDGVEPGNIKEVKPGLYYTDFPKTTYNWIFRDIEPTTEHDIYVSYVNPGEYERYMESRRNSAKEVPPDRQYSGKSKTSAFFRRKAASAL